MSFDIIVVTYRVPNFLPKLVDTLLFSGERTEFPFLNSSIFGCCPFQQYPRICQKWTAKTEDTCKDFEKQKLFIPLKTYITDEFCVIIPVANVPPKLVRIPE